MIVVTGAAGFIGSNILADLEDSGHSDLVACDWFEAGEKWRNVSKRRLAALVVPEELGEFLHDHSGEIEAVIHMGAISSTTERDVDLLVRRNVRATVDLWDWAAKAEAPFIYASSAATYGGIESDLLDRDDSRSLAALRPLNAYGWSKKLTDDIIARRVEKGQPAPPQWVGLKFFNVYGPNEYHKGDMRSAVSKMFDAASAGDPIRLFRSDREGIGDGEQRRDFIYVKDSSYTVRWLLLHREVSGMFNLGTGRAESFLDVFRALESAMGRDLELEFVEMPEALKGRYQYFTRADMSRLRSVGLDVRFRTLTDGVADYVGHLGAADPHI